ncbi:MAG: VRR-NUC domain-containing protein [Candidatus Thiodiazotropha sp.]
MLEKDVENPVCRYARKEHKGMAYKFKSPQRANVPDRIFTFPSGWLIFIEFKAPGKKATPKQRREHERLRDCGQHVYVCDNIELGKWLVDLYAFKGAVT